MPRRKRDQIKRRVSQAHNSLDRTLYHLMLLSKYYEEYYPEHVQYLESVASLVIMAQEYLTNFKKFM